jgi:hypothetical protein
VLFSKPKHAAGVVFDITNGMKAFLLRAEILLKELIELRQWQAIS